MKKTHTHLLLALVAVFSICWSACEDIADDTKNPDIVFMSPKENDNYKVSDTIQVDAQITDNKNIDWLRITLVNSHQQPVSSSINIENINQKKYNLSQKYPVDNLQLSSGTYYLQVEASDGVNTKNGQQRLNITELDKKLQYFLVITNSNPKEVSVSTLDTTYTNKQFVFSEPTDYLDSRFTSMNQQLIISGEIIYNTKAFDLKTFNQEWSIPATGNPPTPYFTVMGDNDKLLAMGYYEGFIGLFDQSGHQAMNIDCNSGLFPYALCLSDEYLIAAEHRLNSGNDYVSQYYIETGGLLRQKFIDGDIVNVHIREGGSFEDEVVIVIGNWMGRGRIWHYDLGDNNVWNASSLYAEKIYTSCKVSDQYYLAGTGKDIRQHDYSTGGTFIWKDNIAPDRLKFDPVTNTVIAIKNNTIYFYDFDSASLKKSVQMNDKVLNVHPIYNK